MVLKKNEINEKIAVIREELRSPGTKNEVSIDCEWEVDCIQEGNQRCAILPLHTKTVMVH